MSEQRIPAEVPDDHIGAEVPGAVDVRVGVDTDGDTRPDTVLTGCGGELLIHTDLDGDGFADQVLGIGIDGTVRTPGSGPVDRLLGPVDVDQADDLFGSVVGIGEP